MIFSSFTFLFQFLPITILVYYCMPVRFRNGWLFLTSLVFYAWGEPKYIGLLLVSIIMNYGFGIGIGVLLKKNQKKSKILMASAVCVNILLLCVFKYLGMFVKEISVTMPIGISFYTFQGISYLIDVYRGDAKFQKNFVDFGTYIAMFPQLIAGPVVRYQSIESQLKHRHETGWLNQERMAAGIRRFIVGFGKKTILANSVGKIWGQIIEMNGADWSVGITWIAVLSFTLQIYFDFSGYSDMAIGLANMFGFTLEENFNYPYQSKSITEFWRRWHISIGTWFREYVYIPLGGNKKGIACHICNILLVWGLTGLWHGASLNFLFWGLYYGVLLILEKYFLNKWLTELPGVLQSMYTMFFVSVGWVLFEITELDKLAEFLKAMFGGNGIGSQGNQVSYLLLVNGIFLVICMIASTKLPKKIWHLGQNKKIIRGLQTAGYLILFLIAVAYMMQESYNPFLYFRF